MAKKSKAAFEFEFSSADLKKLVAKGTPIIFTAFIEEAETKDGEKVGVMRITAKAKAVKGTLSDGGTSVNGGPIPPGGN